MSAAQIFVNIIKKFDSITTPIGLRLDGETSMKTIAGAFFSVFAVLFALYLSLDVFQDFLYFRKPVFSYGKIYNSNNSIGLNFTSRELYFSLSIYKPTLLPDNQSNFDINDYSYVKYFSDVNFHCIEFVEMKSNTD